MSWLSDLFKHTKNKEPTGPEETPVAYQSDDELFLSSNPDGTYQFQWKNTALYDTPLSRACIHRISVECSKAVPEPAKPSERIRRFVSGYPNPYQSVSQFIYQVITITLSENNCYIVPIVDKWDRVTGLWAVSPKAATVIDVNGTLYLRYTFGDGKEAVMEYARVGHMSRMVKDNPLHGCSNAPLVDSALLFDKNIQRSAKLLESDKEPIRWQGRINTALMDESSEQQIMQSLVLSNRIAKKTGVMVTDNRFDKFDPFTRDVPILKPEDQQEMRKNTFLYWGMSEAILTNQYTEDDWNGFFLSAIQPLLIQLGEVLTRVIYTESQIAKGSTIVLDVDRLQYASVKSRIDLAFGVFDRGMADIDTSLGILNMQPIGGEEGQKRYIRGEYRPEDQPQNDGKEDTENARTDHTQSGNELGQTSDEKN